MKRRNSGFTLIELMVTLAVLAIVLSLGAPAFTGLVQRARESNTYHLLTVALATARLQAVRDNAPVTVCPSADGRTCRDDEVWSHGWIVYADPDRSPQPQSDAAVVQHFEGIGKGLRLRSTAGRPRVRFLPSGWAYGSNISIRLCDSGGNGYLGSIIVNVAGRARTERQTESSPCPFTAG